ncbi:MAG: family 43 glycosylhydrolase [Phocaeicola sp.]|nr:family 43 glycosylhydrolase [Phocaeicola sp.]
MKKVYILFIVGLVICFSIKAQVVNPFGKALVPDMIADASIVEIDGTFYCYATTDGYDQGLKTSGPPVVWKSKDFLHWSFNGTYFPSAKDQLYWAPSKVIPANGKYYIYPTINGHMYPAVADSPEGPFRLARGKDEFHLPYTSSTLLQGKDRYGIDAEIFIDDDGQAYAFWGGRKVTKLGTDMITLDSIHTLTTPHKEYSEGPIFFKRKGIYYYLYTIGGDEKYQYAYMMSKVSPFGPYEYPKEDIISTTNYDIGLYGPGHGCVFNLQGTDSYYFAFLEFGRRSTNRQTYVNKIIFNKDGTIQPIKVTMEGVGALRKEKHPKPLKVKAITTSSIMSPLKIEHMKDSLFHRTEYFDPSFIVDKANGSRWMAAEDDYNAWVTLDLGKVRKVHGSDIYFVRPTAGHAYKIETSDDGYQWNVFCEQKEKRMQSPHSDQLNLKCRYIRVWITEGLAGIWEWNIY